ncbi:hypothetical protein K432DRAFT_160088 [Lepidopterella palustris CBS 459.81]|uniref:Uncharacterized protein n=1 Tax=Lepidopterella palustris CBS 459.81 TaxID=1314670 RepID=A0A8E2E281_9PEZI|nr:hypothetical protein K432DRAFT_160088 [Lepidopterella palustris CBS 459.81]
MSSLNTEQRNYLSEAQFVETNGDFVVIGQESDPPCTLQTVRDEAPDKKVREQLPPKANINLDIYNKSNLIGDSLGLPIVRTPYDLFRQCPGATVMLRTQYCNRTAVITHNQAGESSLGNLGRVWKCLEGAKYERWTFADGSQVCSGSIPREGKIIFLDTGHAFRGNPDSQIFRFCIVQESVLNGGPNWGLSDIVAGTPIYRVRSFASAEEGKWYMFVDAANEGIGTIGAYVVVSEGSRVNGLHKKKIGKEEVWI